MTCAYLLSIYTSKDQQNIFLNVEFIRTGAGRNLAILNGYTYGRQCQLRQGERWRCTGRSARQKCNASFILDEMGTLIKSNTVHTHSRPSYDFGIGIYEYKDKDVSQSPNLDIYVKGDAVTKSDMHSAGTPRYIRNERGTIYILLDGYTYGKHTAVKAGHRWQCTTRNTCIAYLVITEDGTVLKRTNHTHAPPEYFVKNDIYINLGGTRNSS
ncbi:hypothetical protein evm_005208 [Chilo suppressalis]|nr:hypothetical protein evm_005208 [Chilo suppressalis]